MKTFNEFLTENLKDLKLDYGKIKQWQGKTWVYDKSKKDWVIPPEGSKVWQGRLWVWDADKKQHVASEG